MKQILREIRDFIKADFNIFAYSYAIIFISLALIYNFTTNFEHSYIDKFFGKKIGYLAYSIYYLSVYYLIAIPTLLIKGQHHKLLKHEFWVKSFVFVGMFAIMTAFYEYRNFLKHVPIYDKLYYSKIFSNIKRIVPFLLVFYIIKLIYDKKMPHLYGLRYGGMNYRPFFWLLLMMIPVIVIASFDKSFQISYPQYKFWRYEDISGVTKNQSIILFWFVYALDFVSIELIFRGALVVGMIKVLGREAVLPMVIFYVVIHFGKPAGEAISSFFGGFILGIHSYYRKNILGGIVIHVGIALSMEFMAIIQYFYLK